jgi:PhzF family phenazine biosynthesis protein
MGIMRVYQVDAFSDQPFRGNPAVVCLLEGPQNQDWMQQVAAEMNLSETAFLYRQGEGFSLRWFTPKVEVDLCGHATLASAHVLWEAGLIPVDQQALFYTKSGLLTARRQEEGKIELDFPAEPAQEATPPPGMLKALGVDPLYCGRNRSNYLLEVDTEEKVRSLKPDFSLLAEVFGGGIIVTSLSASPAYDFVSRFFDPGEGIDEDPVTGSAHCCLGPYWQKRLSKNNFTAYQASQRGGILHLSLEKDNRVLIAGQAVTILRGELLCW